MDVDVRRLVKVIGKAERLRAAADVGEASLCGFLHDIAELPRQDHLPLALEHRRFRRQDIAADFRPGHTHGHADLRLFFRLRREELRLVKEFHKILLRHADRRLGALDDAASGFSADLPDLPREFAHSCLSRVGSNDLAQDTDTEADIFRLEAIFLTLASHQVLLSDGEFLILRIARERDDLHAIAQRPRDIPQVVGRDDPEHLGQVERQVEVMIDERLVLLGIQDLEHGGCGVTAICLRHLVDLIEEEDGVPRPRRADALEDAPRHGTDIRAAMASDLCFIAYTAERDMNELPSERTCHRRGERGLAHTRRADEAEDRRALFHVKLMDSEVVEDAFLDLLEPVVIALKHGARLFDVCHVLRPLRPGKCKDPIEIATDDAGFWGKGVERLQAMDLFLQFLADFLWEVLLLHLLPVGLDFFLLLVAFAELFPNGFDLFPQVKILLHLGHLLPDLGIDLLLQREDVEFPREHPIEQRQAFLHVDAREDLLRCL